MGSASGATNKQNDTTGMERIEIRDAFQCLDSKFLDSLKSQSAILILSEQSDFSKLFGLLTHLATVKKFSSSFILALNNYFSAQNISSLDTPQLNQEAWDFLDGFFDREDKNDLMQLEKKLNAKDYAAELDRPTYLKPYYNVEQAFGYVFKGLMNLHTHSDATSEVMQTYDQGIKSLSKFANSMGLNSDADTIFDSKQASVLVAGPFSSGLPPSVTMTCDDQVDLGIICSPSQPMITSGGWAAYGPYQQFFMINFEYDGQVYNFFSMLLEKRLDLISMILNQEVSEQDLKSMLDQENGVGAFIAFLYFAVHYVNSGEYAHSVEPVANRYKESYALKSRSLVCSPMGCGISFIKLPVGDDYRLATPLNNMGLLKEIHSSYFMLRPDEEDEKERSYWNSLFTRVAVGGTKPQNCGTIFNTHIRGGKIQALKSDLRTQNSGLRYIKQKIRNGKTVFNVTREQALLISNRGPVKDVSALTHKASPVRIKALQRSSERFVYDVVAYLGAMSDLVTQGKISVMELEVGNVTSHAKVERNIILGKASSEDVDQYVVHLRNGIARLTAVTVSERNVITKSIRNKLHELLGG